MASFTLAPEENLSIDENYAVEQKSLGNECFLKGKHNEAISYYSNALSRTLEHKVILYTNRSASYLGLGDYDNALRDADAAIALDRTWLKAYYRKASVYESMGKLDQVYLTWKSALDHCETHPTLTKQYTSIEKRWRKCIRNKDYPILSMEDLLCRFCLLTDTRERLSTLAHIWNDMSGQERAEVVKLLKDILGGVDEESTSLNDLPALPLHNYLDFPYETLSHWYAFLMPLSLTEKKQFFMSVWSVLSDREREEVMGDMSLFLGGEVANGVPVPEDDNNEAKREEEDDLSQIDFSYRKAFGVGKKTT